MKEHLCTPRTGRVSTPDQGHCHLLCGMDRTLPHGPGKPHGDLGSSRSPGAGSRGKDGRSLSAPHSHTHHTRDTEPQESTEQDEAGPPGGARAPCSSQGLMVGCGVTMVMGQLSPAPGPVKWHRGCPTPASLQKPWRQTAGCWAGWQGQGTDVVESMSLVGLHVPMARASDACPLPPPRVQPTGREGSFPTATSDSPCLGHTTRQLLGVTESWDWK